MISYEDREALHEILNNFNAKLDRIEQGVKDLKDQLRSNTDTTEEDREAYLNKIGRMLASGKYVRNETFLRNTFGWVEQSKLITRKQIAAIDRIELNPSRPEMNCTMDFDDDPEW